MGLPFHFSAGEGPIVERPVRTSDDVTRLRTDSAGDLGYVAESVRLVARHFGAKLPVIGFCGAPFTLASYMIEGGGSRHYINTKKMMYSSDSAWNELLTKVVAVTSQYAVEQVRAGADVIQVFDSWVGCLAVEDYRRHVLPRTAELVRKVKAAGVPVIYFGTDTATLLPAIKEIGADVIGLDWRIPLDEGWERVLCRGILIQSCCSPTGNKCDNRHSKCSISQPGGRVTFSILAMAFCRKLRWKMSRFWQPTSRSSRLSRRHDEQYRRVTAGSWQS